MEGIKFDKDKPRWDLLPLDAIEEVVKVLTHGSKKYGDHNWQKVEPFDERYFSALMRHLKARSAGELIDPESNLPHSAHAACCVLFLLWGDSQKIEGLKEEEFLKNISLPPKPLISPPKPL